MEVGRSWRYWVVVVNYATAGCGRLAVVTYPLRSSHIAVWPAACDTPVYKVPPELHAMVASFASSALDCASLRQCAKWVHPVVLEEAVE